MQPNGACHLNFRIGKQPSSTVTTPTIRRTDVYILPEIGNRIADTITRRDVTQLNEKVAFDGARPTPVQARNVHRYLSSSYTFPGSTPCPHTPAEMRGVLSHLKPGIGF